MDSQILFLYAKGMTTREIVATFKERYDADVSPTLISKVTDAVKEQFFRHLLHNWESSIDQHSTACSYQKGNNLPDLCGYFSLPVKLTVKTCCNISIDLIGLRLGNGKYCTLRLFFVLTDINCSQRTILPFCQLLIVSPDIVSCQIYVLPAQRRQV